jgi:hypothetical protein
MSRVLFLPDNSHIVVPDTMSDAAAFADARQKYPESFVVEQPPVVTPPPPEKRTWGEAVTDTGAGLAKGIGSLMQLPSQAAGLITGDMEPGMFGRAGKAVEEFGQGLKSQPLLAKEAALQKRIQEAYETGGVGKEAITAIGGTLKDPALLTSFLAEQIPNFIGSLGTGLVAKLGVNAAKSIAGVAAKEAAQSAAKAGVGASVASGIAMQATDVGAETYQQVYDRLKQTHPEMDDAQMRDFALSKGRIAAAQAAAVSGATQFIPGAQSIEKAVLARGLGKEGASEVARQLAKKEAAKGAFRRGAEGFAGEALQEGIEEGPGGQLLTNLALQEADPTQRLGQGVGAATGMGALAGGIFGGIGGVSNRAPAPPPSVGDAEGFQPTPFDQQFHAAVAAFSQRVEDPSEAVYAAAAAVLPTIKAGDEMTVFGHDGTAKRAQVTGLNQAGIPLIRVEGDQQFVLGQEFSLINPISPAYKISSGETIGKLDDDALQQKTELIYQELTKLDEDGTYNSKMEVDSRDLTALMAEKQRRKKPAEAAQEEEERIPTPLEKLVWTAADVDTRPTPEQGNAELSPSMKDVKGIFANAKKAGQPTDLEKLAAKAGEPVEPLAPNIESPSVADVFKQTNKVSQTKVADLAEKTADIPLPVAAPQQADSNAIFRDVKQAALKNGLSEAAATKMAENAKKEAENIAVPNLKAAVEDMQPETTPSLAQAFGIEKTPEKKAEKKAKEPAKEQAKTEVSPKPESAPAALVEAEKPITKESGEPSSVIPPVKQETAKAVPSTPVVKTPEASPETTAPAQSAATAVKPDAAALRAKERALFQRIKDIDARSDALLSKNGKRPPFNSAKRKEYEALRTERQKVMFDWGNAEDAAKAAEKAAGVKVEKTPAPAGGLPHQRVANAKKVEAATTTSSHAIKATEVKGVKKALAESKPVVKETQKKLTPEDGANQIAKMDPDVRDNTEPQNMPGGYDAYHLYVARNLLPKPSEKLKKLKEGDDLSNDYDAIANVDGEYYGITKQEDPDDPDNEKAFIYSFQKIKDGISGALTNTVTNDVGELLSEIRNKEEKDSAKRGGADIAGLPNVFAGAAGISTAVENESTRKDIQKKLLAASTTDTLQKLAKKAHDAKLITDDEKNNFDAEALDEDVPVKDLRKKLDKLVEKKSESEVAKGIEGVTYPEGNHGDLLKKVHARINEGRFNQARARVGRLVAERAAKLGLSKYVNVDMLSNIGKDNAVAGSYFNKLIKLAISGRTDSEIMSVFNHESVHALRELGMITDQEWKNLSAVVKNKGWIKLFNIEERAKMSDLDEDGQIEEAIADAFATYITGRSPVVSYVGDTPQYVYREQLKLVGQPVGIIKRIMRMLGIIKDAANQEGLTEAIFKRFETPIEPTKTDVAGAPKFSSASKNVTRNSDGQTVYTGLVSGNLREYLKDSVIKDKDGNPILMFHGTAQDISQFRAKQAGAIFIAPDPELATVYSEESAQWMADHADEIVSPKQIAAALRKAKALLRESGYNSSQIAKLSQDGILKTDEFREAISAYMPSGPNVLPMFVRAEKPFDYENAAHVNEVIAKAKELGGNFTKDQFARSNNWTTIEEPTVQGAIKALGYDSFYVAESGRKNLAVYESNQLKSATGNVGTYDLNNPDIRYSVAPKNNAIAIVSGPDLKITKKVDEAGAYIDRMVGNRLDWSDAKNHPQAIKKGVEEINYMLSTDKSGLDWYEEDVAKAFEETAKHIPQLQSEVSRRLFATMAGIMSPQTNARDNWFIAAKGFKHYVDTGTIPGGNPETGGLWQGGTTSLNKKKQLEMLDAMVKDLGEAATVEWLFTSHTTRELDSFRRKYGNMGGINQAMNAQFMGLRALGPKVGPFVMNLNGIHEITVDVWMTRTANRWFGQVVGEDGKIVDAPSEPFRRVVKELVNNIASETGIKPYQVQSVLWFFEQSLYRKIGTNAESYGFSDGAKKYSRERGVKGAQDVRGGDENENGTKFSTAPRYSATRILGGNVINATFRNTKTDLTTDLIYKFQDRFIDLKKLQGEITRTVGGLQDAVNVYDKEALFHNKVAKQTKDFLQQEVRPIVKKMEELGVSMDEMDKYLLNRHAKERNEQIASVNPTMPDKGSGTTTADSLSYLAAIPASKKRDLNTVASMIDAVMKGTRDQLVDGGLEDRPTINEWERTYKHYVPLQREIEGEESGTGMGQGFSISEKTRRAMGATNLDVQPIFAQVVAARERAIVRSEKNHVSQAMYGLALKAPNPDFYLAVDPSKKVTSNDLQYLMREFGLTQAEAANVAEEPRIRRINPTTGLVEAVVNPTITRMRDNVLHLMINGKEKIVIFNPRNPEANRLANSLKNIRISDLNGALAFMAIGTRYFSMLATQLNPVFGIINLMRDVQGGLLNLTNTPLADKKERIFRDTFPAIKGVWKQLRAEASGQTVNDPWAQLFEKFEKAGGPTGYRQLFADLAARNKDLEQEFEALRRGKVKKAGYAIYNAISDYNTAFENGMRLAAFKAALDKNMSEQQAANIAKNLTVNFNRKGSATTQMNALYAFFNASVQGTTRIVETIKGPMGKKIIGGALTLGILQAMALAAAGFDDDQPPEFIKEKNIVIPTFGLFGEGKYFTIPMPLGFNAIPNFSRVITEVALNGGKDWQKKIPGLLGATISSFNPLGGGLGMQTLAPTVVDPLIALAENKDAFGRRIYKEDVSGLRPTPGYTRTKETATPWAKGLAEFMNYASGGSEMKAGLINVTPDQIDYLVGQATGGVGREIGKAAQLASTSVTGEELPTYKIPLVSRFYGDTKEKASESSKFYENLKRVNEHAAQIKYLKTHQGNVSEYFKEFPEARLATFGSHTSETIERLNKQRKLAIERDMPRERVKHLEDLIQVQMGRFNERMKAAQ